MLPDSPAMVAKVAAGVRSAMAEAGINNVQLIREFSDEVLEGFVIRTEPGEGQLVARDRALLLVVGVTAYLSFGQFVRRGVTPVPDLVGDRPTVARRRCRLGAAAS